MSLTEQVSDINGLIHEMSDAIGALQIESRDIMNKLRYDIQPMLDKALEGKTTTEAAKPQLSPNDMLRHLRYAILYASTDRKIEAIKSLREMTNAGLKEAKDTIEWIQERMDMVRNEAIQKHKEVE